MPTVTYQVETELEFQRIIASLDALGIPYTFRLHADLSFPVLGHMKPYAEISISKDYQEMARTVFLNEAYSTGATSGVAGIPSSGSRFKIGWILLITYAVLATIFLFKYWYIQHGSSEDRNFTYRWSLDNTYLFVDSKKSGQGLHTYVDEDYNFNFEELNSYFPDGTPMARAYDRNENGFFEHTLIFNLSGQLTATHIDLNDDGIVDDMKIILDSGDTLHLIDRNGNGFFETMK